MADEAQGTEVDFDGLQAPFSEDKIQWRVRKSGTKQNGEPYARIVPYPDARALMDRLDEVCGPARWRTDFVRGPSGGVVCSLSIRVDGEWVAKEDGAENTDIESVKGGLTDAFKRACVMWNVGGIRRLYHIGDKWATFHDDGQYEDKIDGTYYRWDPPGLDGGGAPERDNRETKRENPATEKQIGYIHGLADDREMSDKQRDKLKRRMDGGMTKGEASKAIEWLQSLPEKDGDDQPEMDLPDGDADEHRLMIERWLQDDYGENWEIKLHLLLSQHPGMEVKGNPENMTAEQWATLEGQLREHGRDLVESPREVLDAD